MKRLFCLLSLVCLLIGCIVDEHSDDVPGSDDGSIVRVGDRLPHFSVDVVDGSSRYQFSSTSLQGPTVIVFFNTGCKDCQRELPELNAYYLRHRSETGFRMVAIAREESQESIVAYWAEHHLSLPYSPQTDRAVYSLFATLTIPRVYICSADGRISWMGIESFELPED